MPICTRRKLAFCHIPRTGGRAVIQALGMKVVDKHESASWFHRHYPGYHLFSTYRSDRDRVESALRRSYTKPEELDERMELSLRDPRGLSVQPNAKWLDWPVDTLLRYECLEDDLNSMLESLGFESVVLSRVADPVHMCFCGHGLEHHEDGTDCLDCCCRYYLEVA